MAFNLKFILKQSHINSRFQHCFHHLVYSFLTCGLASFVFLSMLLMVTQDSKGVFKLPDTFLCSGRFWELSISIWHFQTRRWEINTNSRQPATSLEMKNMNVIDGITHYISNIQLLCTFAVWSAFPEQSTRVVILKWDLQAYISKWIRIYRTYTMHLYLLRYLYFSTLVPLLWKPWGGKK